MIQIIGGKLNCVDFIMSGEEGQHLKGDSVYFVVQKNDVI